MQETFRSYYPPSESEIVEMWKTGLVVLDTNALLNLFRYSISSQEDYLRILENLSDRLWIPHQVALEFHKRRLDVIEDSRNTHKKVKEQLEKAGDTFLSTLRGFRKQSSVDVKSLIDMYEEGTGKIYEELKKQEEAQSDLAKVEEREREIWDRIANLFRGRVGKSFTEEALEALYAEGEKRFEKEIPPGFRDKGKGIPGMYGDLLIWMQILEYSKSNPNVAIFVTDDRKEDWWSIRKGKTSGPRQELIEEFYEASGGKRVHFYSVDLFLEVGKERLTVEVNESTLEEVRNFSAHDNEFNQIMNSRTFQERPTFVKSIVKADLMGIVSDTKLLEWEFHTQRLETLDADIPQKYLVQPDDFDWENNDEPDYWIQQAQDEQKWNQEMVKWHSTKLRSLRTVREVVSEAYSKLIHPGYSNILLSDIYKLGEFELELERLGDAIHRNFELRRSYKSSVTPF